MVIVELSQPSIVVSREGVEYSEVVRSSSLFRWKLFYSVAVFLQNVGELPFNPRPGETPPPKR